MHWRIRCGFPWRFKRREAPRRPSTDSIRSGVLAGLTGLVLVLAFVMIYYRFAGIVAFLGLLVNIIILFGAMAMFNFVLTLPGIAESS